MARVANDDAEWTLGAVGDVFVNRPDPTKAFDACAETLRRFDLVFGNCEGAYTDRPHFAPSAGWRVVAPAACARGLSGAGFHVMACANNHSVDAGHEGLFDTLDVLQAQGIATIGAGRDLAHALAPAIRECKGIRVGFLGFASVYQPGYEARKNVPGLAALRIHSHCYIPDWDAYGKVEPGVRPQVRTFPYPEDLAILKDAVAALRREVDVVIVSHHWGKAGQPAILTEYERILGRASIDAGADVVLGHHHHFLRGVEIYRDRPSFYGLGHFVFDLPDLDTALTKVEIQKLKEMGEYAIYPRTGYPLSPFHPDARMTVVAAVRFRGATLTAIGFIPCMIDQENQAQPIARGKQDAIRIVDYLQHVSDESGLHTKYGGAFPASDLQSIVSIDQKGVH